MPMNIARRFLTLLALTLLLTGQSETVQADREIEPGSSTIVVGGDHSYPPYEFLDENGEPAGYNVELTRAIAEVMGMEVEIRLGDWGEMRRALAAGEVDILQGMAYLTERTDEVDFSPPHTIVYQSIWTRTDGPAIDSVRELRGKEVIVMRDSVMHDFMGNEGPEATLIPTDSLAAALTLLASGRHDCALVAKLPGQYLSDKLGLTGIVPQARSIAEQPYGYAVKKGNRSMLARFNEGLVLLKKSGRYQQIHNKWLGVLEPTGVPWKRIVRIGALIIVPLLLVLGVTVMWSRTLKREVAARTAALEREVVERRRAMEELEVRQKQLIQADKMTSLGILVSGVAHEINNPTGLLLLNLPLLQKSYTDALPILERHYEEQGDFRLGWLNYSRMRTEIPGMFDEMVDGARRIKRIVEDLKDFARSDDSDLSGKIDLNRVIEAALRLVDNTIRKSTSRFEVDYAPDLPTVRGNPHRIEQVVVNLVLNACQALSSSDAGIFLATSYDPIKGEVIFTVHDEGAGIDAAHLPHLTDPFFTTRREEGGTGLGLSVSAGIVKEHGGVLHFDSAPGRGMTVTLALPVQKKERPT